MSIGMPSRDGKREPRQRRSEARAPEFSPDGRWLASLKAEHDSRESIVTVADRGSGVVARLRDAAARRGAVGGEAHA